MAKFCRFNNLSFLYQTDVIRNSVMQRAMPVAVSFFGTINTAVTLISRLQWIQPAIDFAKVGFPFTR
ncbi:Uncharacterised protein [Shigella sonnei]|nr:Uncharacterised protein [Shigella sonnei]CSI39460.1 Uncharacterised protein [Shigella sonnei]